MAESSSTKNQATSDRTDPETLLRDAGDRLDRRRQRLSTRHAVDDNPMGVSAAMDLSDSARHSPRSPITGKPYSTDVGRSEYDEESDADTVLD